MATKVATGANLPELLSFLKNVRTLNNQMTIISRLPLTEEQHGFIKKTVKELSKTADKFLASEQQV